MNLPLIGALVLSVVGWTAALYYWGMYRIARRLAVQATFESMVARHRTKLNETLLAQALSSIQVLQEKLEDDIVEGDEWKHQ